MPQAIAGTQILQAGRAPRFSGYKTTITGGVMVVGV